MSLVKISKATAREEYNSGVTIYLLPSKATPESGLIQPKPINIQCGTPLDSVVYGYKYYNCNKDTGLKVSYYIEKGRRQETMKVITIQPKDVLITLKKRGKYTVPNNAPIDPVCVEPYKFMMKHYKYSHRPIFLCPVGHQVHFGGSKTQGTYIVEMDIPSRFCKIQDYYGWHDFIYFVNEHQEYEPFNGCETVDQFGKYILNMYKNGFGDNKMVYQVTTQFLRAGWVKKVIPMNQEFIDKYINIEDHTFLTSITQKG